MAERPLYTLYKNLKAQNYDVPNDYNKFESALTRDGKSGADNRHAIYENLKAQNFDVPDTYERFYTALFEPRSKTSSRAKGGSVPMSAADRARFLSGAAAISASAKQIANNAGRYNRLKQRKQKQQKDFGRVNLGTHLTPFGGDANDVVKDEFAYNPETGKAGAYVTSDNENAYTQSDAEQKQAILDKYGEEWNKAVDMGMVPSELDKADPDMSETDVAMRQMERRQEWLDENQNRRSQELNESMHLQDSPFVASGGAVAPSSFNTAIGNEANRLSDAEYGAYNTAKAYNQMLRTTLLQELKEQKQRNENAGWWKDKWNDVSNYFGAMFNTMLDPKLYSQGVMDAAIASNLLQVKKGMEDGTIKKGSNAGEAAQVMLSAIQQQQGESAKQQQYGTKAYLYGDISGRSLKFWGDFALSGWRNVMTTGFTKAGEKVGEKMALGTLGKWFTKNTGRVLGDMAGSAALAATNQLGSTYNNVIERYVGMNNENGGVTQDKDGDLKFNEGVSLGKAIKDGLGSATIENFSEMFGEYLPGASKLLSKLGLSKVSSFFEKIGNNAYYKWLSNATNKSGIQGVMAEISEEEFGTALHAAWGDGDGSWSDFNVFTNPDAREKQIDTCLGMFYSVGFMRSPRTAVGAINAVRYFNLKHQVTKADKFGQMMFGDNWDEIKSKIDVTTNADLTKTVLDATRSDSMTAKQKGAVINYAMFLSKLRGFNQASDAKTKDKVEEGETVPTLSNYLDDAYTEGHNADDADKHDIQIQHEDQSKTLAAALNISEQQLSGMSDEELESLTGQDDKLDQAIYDYQLSSARYQGVVDDAQDKVDLAAHQAEQRVNMYTDQSRGSVRNATIKASGGAEDYGVYIISGNIATHEDGSIDVSNSDDMILYFDPTTNSVEHADALMFAELGEELPAADVKAQAVADAKENAIKEIAGIIDGTVEVGSQFNVTDADGTEHTYEVLADNGDGTAMITIDGNVPTELVKGENVQVPYSFEDLQKMKDLEDQKRLEAAKAEREQMEKERDEQQTEEAQPSFDFNQILNDDGNVVLVDVLGKDGNTKYPGSKLFLIRDAGAKAKVVELKSDGTIVPHAVNKEDVATISSMSLDEYKQAVSGSSVIEDNSGENRGEIEVETPTTEGEAAGPAEETATSESGEDSATEQTPAITLEDGTIVPMLEDGNPDFSKLSAAQTAELYDSQFGEDADGIVSGYVSDAKKALDKANNMTVKGKTFVEQKAAKDAKEKAIADAQAAYDSAVAIRDAYNERQLAKEENTPEGRKSLIEKARRKYARLKNSEEWSERPGDLWNETVGKLLHRLYDATGIDVFNDTPNTVYEYVAENVGPYSLNYEGNDNSKGVQQETGLSRSDFAKLGWLAAEGKGMTIDAKVHRLWENRPSNLESADTQEIRNALISLITSGQTAFQARDYILNQRIELAESALEEQLRQEEDAAEAQKAKEEEEKKKAELEKKKAEEEKTNENRNAPELSHEQQKAMEEGEKLGFPAVDKEGEPINQNVIELANWAKEQGLEIDPTSKLNSYADLYVMCKNGFGVSTLVPDVGENINQVFYLPDNVQGEQLLKLQEEFNVGRDLKHSADMNSELTEGAMFYDGDTAREFKEFVDKKVEEQNKVFGEQRPEEDLPFSAKDNGQQQTTAERAADVEKNKVDDIKVVDNIVGQKTRKAFDRLAKMMGAEIQWQYSDKLGNGWIQETKDADGNVHRTIFITLDSSITEGAQFIFGHEMTHQIKNLNPAAYNELTQLILDTYGSDAFDKAVDETTKRYSDAGFSGRSRDYYAEEVVADAVGEMIRDLNLAHTLAMKMSHPLLAAIHEILQKIKLAFFGTEYSDVTKNIIRSIEQAYVKTANGQVVNPETGEDVSFSLRLKSAIDETETNPSDAQKESGNYKKGHIKFGGYDYTIENPKGSTRSGKDADGKEWKVTMHDTYGYIRGKFGKDGDHLDMFINDKADLDNWKGDVFVVDQVNPDGSFDEHKVMYGYDSMDGAKKAYLANYSDGWQGLGNITGASKDEFDKWLDTSNRKLKPFADYANVKFSQAQSVDNEEPKTFEEFLNHPLLKFSIKNEEQRKAAEDAYEYAAKLRPNKYAQYAIVDMSKPSKIPEYYEKKVLADNWRRFYNRAVHNELDDVRKKAWGNYKLFDLDRPFADQVNEVKGKVPDKFNAPDKVTNKDNIKGLDRQVSSAAEPHYSLKDEKTLAGVHNITEEKLLKAIKQGGLANPSVAVIDSSKQNHEDYGDISLILPSDKVAKRTGKNAGTWQGDAWTPTYPQVERQMSNKGAAKASKDVSSVPGDMYREVRRGLDRWLDGGEANSAMAYMFLYEKGLAPEPKKIQHKFGDDVYNELKLITAGDFNIYGIGKADAQKVLDMYIDAKFDGDKDLYEEKTNAWLERNKSIVDAGNKGGMRYTIAKDNVELYDKYGFNYKSVQTFVRDVEYDHRKTGVDMNATLNDVEDYIKTNNLTDEFNTWLEGKEKEYGIKEVIFDGFTPSGNRRYVPNTLENVSKVMKKQGRNGATGISVSFQNFAASLMPSYGTLKDIRSKKGLLTSDHEDLDKFTEKWSKVFFELGMKCQPDATGTFDDYGLARLSEAAKTSDPQAYLKKEYNVDFSDEDTKRLKEMVKAIKEESPAMYFETKFERPVGFNEFSSAVVPTTASDEVKQALQNAGVQIYEYDKEKEGDRNRAFNEAINSSENIRFSLKAMMEKPDGWKQANKKAIHIAEAIERDPKFSLKNLDGTLIKAGTYFSGGGLVEEGLKGIIDPVVAVEYDEKISGVYRNNFGQHIVTADVRDVDPKELVKQIDGEVEYFHASPVCKNYSQAKSNHAEVELDKETAASTAEFINAVKPKVVTIENVKGYKDSEAMKTITDALDANGYTWDADVYNAADYGGYTNRERLIVRAVRDGKLPEKPKKMARKSGWYEAVEDIIPTLTEKKNGVAPWMDIRLKADGIDWRNIDKPLYVMGSAYADGKIPHAFADELLPTLRTKSGDVIVMPDGKVYRAMGRVLARVSGVSDDYKMPFSENLSHTIIGNGIPTQLTEHVIAPLLTGSDPKFSIRTYHGTGASFDKFDLSHALEGEGSESFGHGVYVTNSSKIGREYAQRAKNRKMEDLYKNMRYPDGVKGDIFKRRVFGEMVNDVATGGSVASAKEFAKKRVGADANDIQRTLENLKDREKGSEYEQNLKDRLAEYKEGLNWIDSLEEDYLTQGNAYRYDVDIPDDNGSNYLDWNESIPSTISREDIAERMVSLESDGKDDIEMEMLTRDVHDSINDARTGKELYESIAMYLGDKEASKLLHDMGFVGIKYPAGTIYGGAKEGDYNYVIFDENNANIVGNTRFSLRYDQFEHDLNQWKKDNNLPKDAKRPTIPQRNAGESAVDFLRRVDEYRKQMALWKTAPTYEQHLLSDDTALGEFNRELQRGSVLKRIAFQDSMLAIRKAQEAIMKEVGVDRLNMAEDAYTAENRSHGKGKNEFEEYNNEFLQPLRKAYHQMKKVLGDRYDNVRLYMMAKHGLERNAQMAFKESLEADYEDVAQRSAAYKAYKGDISRMGNDSGFELGLIDYATWVREDNAIKMKYSPSYMKYRYDKMGITFDYSGLSALFDGSDFEEAAHKLVRDIESKHIVETKELWDATNAATKKILRDGYKAGMMSKDTYQYVRDMYSHYIPLRGWDGTTADQVWDYVGGGNGAFNQTLKKAHGRTSIADDPIAYIENMAESGILLNNKNWVKQHLMLLAQNHPTSLLTLSKAWYVKSADANGNEEWIPATPQITSQMNSNQVKAAIDAFEQKMEQMEQTGDATQKRDGLNIAYPQTHSEEREHEVRVMKDGEEYVIYVNGDPQLAQAMNNTRAHRVREIQSGKLDRAAAWLGRKMAAAYTSLSPLFIPSNYFRDLTMTLASTAIREDGRYNYLLRKNLATSWNLGFMLRDYQNGKLREKVSNGNATPKEQMFYDFMMNGGETGFVSSLDVEDLKKKFKNDLKDLDRWKANPVKVGHTIMDGIEFLNRAIEDSNRFAIYRTSIQYGRSIDEAVNDAKDVTLNFNRKGTGEYGWQMIRNLYLFINPAVQSLQTLGALVKHHPFKFTAVTASWLASGVLVPIVNAALMSLLGGDDDKDKYWQFTKWDRRNNLIMWIPFTHEYVKIPLAQEFRAFYGVGDMIASKMMGGELAEESWSQYAEDLLGQVVDMLPLDPTGYDGNIAVSLMPNAIRPIFELAFNVDFTGKPLFKDTEYNKYDPNFTKAYVGTPDWLVRASRMVNSIGNDYPDVQQNSIDAFGDPRYNLNNPGVVDHVLSSYLGGAYTMGSQVLGVLTKSLNDPKEIKVADIPLFSKFVSNPDDRPVTKKQGDEFWDMKENHDRAANTLSKLKKQAKVDGDYSMLERFYGSEEYKQYKQDDMKVKKYEEDKKKERAEESGEEYRPHKLNAGDIYKTHATPKDDFEDLKLEQLYTKLNGFKSTYDLLVDTAPSQSDGYYNTNKASIDAIDEITLDKQEISELKKGFLDDGKDAYNAEDMKQIRELRKKILAVLEKANKVVVANQKAKAKKK